MLTLYGHPSSRAHRVLWMLKELGVPYHHVPTGFLDGGCKTPEYLSINPNGRVPTLVDGDVVLFESLAINLYLAAKFGGPLAPIGPHETALATQWSLWVANEIEKKLVFTAANLLLFSPEQRRAEEAAMGLQLLGRPFQVLNAHLQRQQFLLGDHFTVADLNVAAVLSLGQLAKVDFSAYAALAAWLSWCLERPQAVDWKTVSFTIPRPPSDTQLIRFM